MSEMIKPPRWAQRLLRALAAPETLEEVDGDLEELFKIWTQTHGTRKAKWIYVRSVLTLLRPFSKNKSHSKHASMMTTSMLQSFFIMSWRTLMKNRVSTLINIAGLSLGLATSIIILLVVMDEFAYDKFHSKLPEIYLLMKNQKTNDGISTGESTAGPMAEALRKDYPGIESTARQAGFDGQQVLIDTKITYESGIYADPDLFRIMTFKTLEGQPEKALESGAVILTSDMAIKLFGNQNAVGRSFVFNKHVPLTVGAVIENVPKNSSVRFGMVIPFRIFEKENEWLTKWDDNRIRTWMRIQPNADIEGLNDKMTKLLQERSNDKTVSLFAYPFSQFHLHNSFSNGKPNGGQIIAVYMLVGFGAFMLLIACINFMNMATAQSEYRAREVGVRKVLGASRKLIMFQFLNESFTISFLSLLGAIGLAMLIIRPFNELVHASIEFEFTNLSTWALLFVITFVTAIIAGSYPALFLSRFLPAKVLKGRVVNRSGGGLRKALVTFQFIISSFFLIGTIIMHAQFEHVRNRPIGYDQANLINVQLDSILNSKLDYIKTEIGKLPGIVAVTASAGNILYSGGAVTGMDWPGKRADEELSIAVTDVDYNWTKTMEIPMIEGRDFDEQIASDKSACILNESAVTKMGLANPVGSMVGGHEVLGVFKNFVYNNPSGVISPMAIYLNPRNANHLYLRVRNNDEWRQSISGVESVIKKLSPEFPFDFSFTKDEYQHRFNEISDTSLMISLFGSMTIFISSLGLFGLAGFVAEKRSKEMSIRKVFGASVSRILSSLSVDFLKPVLYALVIVIPASIFIASWALTIFVYRVPLQWWMFASATVATLTIACFVVLFHGWRTAIENPIVRLRDE